MKSILVSAFLGCMMVAMVAAKRCDELPKDISHDARITCQPFVHNLYYSNNPKIDQCIQLFYIGNRDGNETRATALFQTAYNNASYPLDVIVAKAMNQWNTTDDAGNKVSYRKLIMNDSEHYFCLYSCEDEGEFIQYLRCFALNKQGADEIQKKIKENFNNELPLRTELTMVFNCDYDRKGGFIQASGSVDECDC